MKTKILVMAIFLVVGYVAIGGTGEPGHSMMSALVGIQDAIMALDDEPEEAEKEWLHEHYKVESVHNDALFIVPAGRQFVVRKLYTAPDSAHQIDWYLAADDTSILDGSINKYGFEHGTYSTIYKYEHDFPDGCLTIDANETLNAVNNYPQGGLNIIVVGYFRDMPLP